MSQTQADQTGGVVGTPAAVVPVAPEPPPPPRPSLKSTAIRASKWALIGYGGGYFLRFVSTLVVTREIDPEQLGIVLFAQVIIDGLGMCTDWGINQSVIRHRRGEEQRFLNTAWTFQILLGLGVFLGSCLLAWPVAAYKGDSVYLLLLPAMGGSMLVWALLSTSVYLLQRHMAMSKVTILELSTNSLGMAVTILVGWKTESLWAVVCGMYATTIAKAVISHWVIRHIANRLAWDWTAFREIITFGKWIWMSSAVSFVSRQTDRLILGTLLVQSEMRLLQFYGVAMTLSEVAVQLSEQLTRNVLFPAFSRVRDQGIDRLRNVYYRVRLRLDMLGVFVSGGVMAAAPWIVSFLYDDRYAHVTWILRALCVRAVMACVLIPCENVLFSMGHSRYGFYRNIARAAWIAGGVPIGWHLGGFMGIVWTVALSEIPVLLVLWPVAIRHRVFSFVGEMRSVAIFVAGLLAGYTFLQVAPQDIRIEALRPLAVKMGIAKPRPTFSPQPIPWGEYPTQ